MTNLAVLGSPIAHSRSPRIHGAAYASLGLDWTYDAIEQSVDTVTTFLESRDKSWRGVSVTAPLKERVAQWVDRTDATVSLTGSCNTVAFETRSGWNTDVAGIINAFAEHDVAHADSGIVLGAGGTARSAALALARMGANRIMIAARRPEQASWATELSAAVGVHCEVVPLREGSALPSTDLVVSTLPAAADLVPTFLEPPRALLDVDYARTNPRFEALANDTVLVSGALMLLHQALHQVRIFVNGEPSIALKQEHLVFENMRAASGLF
ncbi:shikimate dehydrogenase family protein [Humidisolicoccus flavus]|uniref:shikimate dehydrogenase family protein n=1 Tax=Humidisolicoccus flavus TaxID=3111414 RepID=UPI00325341E1